MSKSQNGESPDRADDVETEIGRLETIAVRAIDRSKRLEDAVDELEQRVEQLEAENDRLRERLSGSESKREKIAAVIEHAQNKRTKGDVVAISREELRGIYGCSRRYSYTLVDEDEGLPNEFAWILSDGEMNECQYGNLEKEGGEKRIGVDFEGVHRVGCPVNRFITHDHEEGTTQ